MEETHRETYEDFPKYNKVQRIIQTTEGMFYLYEAYNKKEKTFSLYSRKINTTDGKFEDNEKLFTTSRPVTRTEQNAYGKDPLTSVGQKSSMAVYSGVKFGVYQSFDKSKVLIQYRIKPEEKRDKLSYDILGFKVYDASMTNLWGAEQKMPHTEKEMNNLAYTVGSNGKAYMLSYLNEEKKFEFIQIDGDGLSNNELEVESDILIQRLKLIEDESGNIICAGYYANGYDFKGSFNGNGMSGALSFNADGAYCFKVSSDGEVVDTWKIEFPMEVIKKYLNERQAEKLKKREAEGKAGVADLKLVEFFAQADGSFILIGEQKYVRNEFYMTGTTNVMHLSNIIATKVSKDGEVIWMKKLPKNQAAPVGDRIPQYFEGQLGIKYVEGNGSHYILFVDNPKNENLAENKVPAAHKNGMGGYLSAFKIDDESGDWERHTITNLGDLGNKMKAYQFSVIRICEAAEKVFMMEIYIKGKKDTMVKMELKD